MQIVRIKLDKDELASFAKLANRLEMEPEIAARYLLKAAVQALEPEEQFVWPIYLVQAGTEVRA